MNRIGYCQLIITGLLLTLASLAAGTEEAPYFAVVDHADTRKAELVAPGDALFRAPAQLDLARLQNDGRIRFRDENGHDLVLERSGLEEQGPGSLIWRGRVLKNAKPVGGATLTVQGDRIHGIIRTRQASYRVTGSGDHGYVIDGIDRNSTPASHPPVTLPTPGPDKTATMRSAMVASDEPAVVDLMAYYTSAAADAYASEADLRLAIRSWVNLANTAYINSDIDHRVRLLGMVHRAHTENPASMPASLVNFAESDSARRVRDLYSADLQAQYGIFSDYCGIAYLLTEYLDDWEGGYSTNNANPSYPCGVINVLAHEMGHNMGLHHDPDTAGDTVDTIEPFAFGHVMPDQFTTVMAYHPGCGGGEYDNCGSSIDYFSDPTKVDPVYGLSLGVANERHNSEVLRRSMPYAAQWRETPFGFEDITGGRYTSEGAGLWAIQNEATFRGNATFISGPVYGEEESRLILERDDTEATTLRFSARGQADASGQGKLTIHADDSEIMTIDDLSGDWQKYKVDIPENTATITWSWTSPGRPSADDGLGVVYMTLGKWGGGGSSGGCSLSGHGRPDPLFLLMLALAAGCLRRPR